MEKFDFDKAARFLTRLGSQLEIASEAPTRDGKIYMTFRVEERDADKLKLYADRLKVSTDVLLNAAMILACRKAALPISNGVLADLEEQGLSIPQQRALGILRRQDLN